MEKPYYDRVEQDSYTPDYTLPPKDLLVGLMNYANRHILGRVIKPEEVIFTPPVETAEGNVANTLVRIKHIDNYRVNLKSRDIYYNRLDINLLAKALHFSHLVFVDNLPNLKSTTDLLPYIRKVLPICLNEEDIIDEKIWIDPEDLRGDDVVLVEEYDEDETIVEADTFPQYYIKMHPDNYAYTGTLRVELRPKPVKLENVVKVYNVGSIPIPK